MGNGARANAVNYSHTLNSMVSHIIMSGVVEEKFAQCRLVVNLQRGLSINEAIRQANFGLPN
jgi:hypothetical protein